MASLFPKLDEILKEKYKLKKGVKQDVEILNRELKSMQLAIGNVAEVPGEQLGMDVERWERDLRALSRRTEVVVDIFLARVLSSEANTNPDSFKGLTKKMNKLLRGHKARRQIASSIKNIKDQIREMAERKDRYAFSLLVEPQPQPQPQPATSIDPRLPALYVKSAGLVGVHGKTDQELIRLLLEGDQVSSLKLKVVSIVGFGGLGKTSLARAVYQKIKGEFDCAAFVSVGLNPNSSKVLMDILLNLDNHRGTGSNPTILDAIQLVQELRDFLQNRRYLIVIDDIWDASIWHTIECALFDNNLGSRIITTTRMELVARSAGGVIYRMKPLNDDDSKRLFYERIFSKESNVSDYPDEIKQASNEILKKCGGVPLVIISVASILCSHQWPKSEWETVLKTISGGLTKEPDMDKIWRILSLSYDDLPSHLKTCSLYLSVFPEGYEIERDRLIRKWIAEGFVHGNHGHNLFETGESYFNELIDRSMIQPINNDWKGLMKSCRVHDIMLDFLHSLSTEDNFVTVLHEQSTSGSQSKIRRLSLQCSRTEQITHWLATTSMLQVRSLTVFGPAIDVMPSLSHFQALRVLDLEDSDPCESDRQIDLRCVGNLFHLTYLGLKSTNVRELPMEIGKLQFLQTLDVRGNGIIKLPQSVIQLIRLVCLHIEGRAMLPAGAGNLMSLEELNKLQVDPFTVEELGHLIELRVLVICWGELGERLNKTLMKSIRNLHNLQSVEIESLGGDIDLMREGWEPPPNLCRFESYGDGSFLAMPRWINPSSLPRLSHLAMKLDKVLQEDIQILGMLPVLHYVCLNVTGRIVKTTVEGFMVSVDAFPSLRECCFYNFVTVPSMFPEGAMPRLQFLGFSFCARDIASSNLDFGMRNLPFLERVHVDLWCQNASNTEVEEMEATLRRAAENHPNCPTLDIQKRVR